MTKLFKYTLPMVALCGALASCSDETTSGGNANNNDGKELIALSGNDNGVTRAALTRGGFSAATTVEMRIKAEDKSGANTTARYAKATATASAASGNDLSSLTYADGMARYWDDAFGRNSKLTIYAFAIPGQTSATLPTWADTDWQKVDASTNPNWYIGTEYTKVKWGVSTAQTSATRTAEDLTYSNNISADDELGKGGRYYYTYDASKNDWTENKFGNGPLTWTAKATGETTGRFDKGHLVFKHALAKIEINLKEDNGFDNNSSNDFKWTNTTEQNITLTGFNTSGTFDVSTGSWDGLSSSKITQMDETTGTPAAQTTRKLYAYVLPGTNLYTTSTNVAEFEIDNSQYYVTGTQIANAIRKYYENATDATADYKNFTTIEAGKHYIINLKVAKKGVEVTAAIVEWGTVNSDDADAQNTYATFELDDRGSKFTDGSDSKFNLYRAAKDAGDYITANTVANYDWKSGYEVATDKSCTSNLWKTNWYYDNNKTYYHFRAAGATEGASSITIDTDANSCDYFTIGSGSAYKDYIWGAPFNMNKDNGTYKQFTYSTTNGFDGTGTSHQLAQAISSTGSQINMLLFHVTSHITVKVKTTTDDNKVTLDGTNTKVEILNFLPNGKVLVGNGLVTAYGDRTSYAAMTIESYNSGDTSTPAQVAFSYGIVPQALSYTGGTIGLRITTPDGNQYVVSDLSKCTATAVTNDNLANPYTEKDDKDNYIITSWYPGYKYTYNITIKKTGIERITAAVVGWETVTGKDIEIDLEN